MGMVNAEILAKADFQLSDLRTDGGALSESKANQFIQRATVGVPLLEAARTTSQKAIIDKVPKIRLIGPIMHRSTDGEALAVDDRSKPVTSEVEITTTEFKAEIDITDGTLLENVQGNTFLNLVEQMAPNQIGIDTQNIMIKGDTTSTTFDFAAFDGCRELVTSHTVDCSGAALSEDKMFEAIDAIPEEFSGMLDNYVFAMARRVQLLYQKELYSRDGAFGALMLQQRDGVPIGGVKFKVIPGWPATLGMTANRSDMLLVDWKNFIISYWRTITFERERMPRAGKTALIFTLRVGCQYEEEEAVVKLEDILAA